MKVISSKICPFVQRVTALFEAKSVPYNIEYVDLCKKPEWFLTASPNGQVPILFTNDGQVLFESDAIVEYVDEVAGSPLYPDDPVDKAQTRAWAYLASKNYLVQCGAQRSPDAQTLNERAGMLRRAFDRIERVLGDHSFARGDLIGMVEIAWLPLLHRAAVIEANSGFDFIAGFPRVKTWQGAVLETGLAEKSVSEDFEERFKAFYLASETHLGRLARERYSQVYCGWSKRSDQDMACCS